MKNSVSFLIGLLALGGTLATEARAEPEPIAEKRSADAAHAELGRESPAMNGSGWVLLPGASYTPERGASVAVAALRYFRLDRTSRRASRVVLTGEGGLSGRGTVSLDPNVWFLRDRLNLAGTVWVSYLDYPYFGVGNETTMSAREDFTAFRVTLRPELIGRIAGDLYGGGLWEFRYEDLTEVESGGALDSGGPIGSDGGKVSGVGLLVRWDSRDNSFAPRSGGVVTLSPRLYGAAFGGDFDFTRLLLEASWFFGLGGEHVLAVDGRVDARGGDPPFNYLSLAGGSRLLRGMLEGRFRDRHFVGAQAEYRYPLWWRFGGVAFAGLGRVASRLGELGDLGPSDLKYSVGGGLRFALQEEERIQVRLDFGRSNDDQAFYFGLLEAF